MHTHTCTYALVHSWRERGGRERDGITTEADRIRREGRREKGREKGRKGGRERGGKQRERCGAGLLNTGTCIITT